MSASADIAKTPKKGTKMKKSTNTEIIGRMLYRELSKDKRFASLSFEAALAAIKIDNLVLNARSYLLYTAYKHGLSQLRKNEKFFKAQAKYRFPREIKLLNRKIEYRKILIDETKKIFKEVDKEQKALASEELPF